MRNLVLTVLGLLFAGAAYAAPAQYSYSQCYDIVYTGAGAKAKEAQQTCQERREVDFVDCLEREYANLNSYRSFLSNKAVCAARYSNGPTREELLCSGRLEAVGFNQTWALSLCKWTTRNSIQNCIALNAPSARTDVQREAIVRSCYNQDAVGELTETGVNRVELERKRKAAEAKAAAEAAEARRRAEEQRRQEEYRREAARREQERLERERNNRPPPPPPPVVRTPTPPAPPAPPAPAKPVVTQPAPLPPPVPVKTETPKAEPQKTEAPKSEVPKTQPSKTEPSKPEPKKETPKAETPRTEAPKTETPKSEPKKETPKQEAPRSVPPVEDRSTRLQPGPVPSGTETDSAKPQAPKAEQPQQQPSQSEESKADSKKDEKEEAKDNSSGTPAKDDGVIVDLPLFE